MPAIKHTLAHVVALLVASASTLPTHVDAQQAAPGNTSWPACRQTAMTTPEMNGCAAAGARLADERMNKSYDAVACHLGLDDKALLAAAQRARDAFREANCAFWRGDGSIGLMNQLDCRASLANARAVNSTAGRPTPLGMCSSHANEAGIAEAAALPHNLPARASFQAEA